MMPNAQGPQALVGQVIAGYRLERVLGVGATGAVYLGVRGDGGEPVAVKLLMPPLQLSAEERADFQARFRREAQALLQLRHPHIVSIVGFGEDPATGYGYMLLPYLGGGTLGERLVSGALPLAVASSYASQIADALDYAHGQGIVHRDLKPANILFDAQGQLYLGDFSIARLFDNGQPSTTTTGRMLGTPEYMAPEQALGQHIGPAADVYGLGVLLYQMVTGRVPFQAATLAQALLLHLQAAPQPPAQLRPDLPPPAEAAILRALAKNPAERFASAGELARAFAFGLAGQWTPGLVPQPQYAMPGMPPMGNVMPPIAPGGATVAQPMPLPTISVAPARARRRGRGGAVVAVLSVILVTSAVVGLLTNVGNLRSNLLVQRGSIAPTPTPKPSHWVQVASPTNYSLYGLAMTSANEGWAVGMAPGNGTGSVLLHYTGGHWRKAATYPSLVLIAISMTSPTDGWAVGGGGPGYTLALLHFDGHHWTRMPSTIQGTLNAISMVSPTEGWGVGARRATGSQYPIDILIVHFVGGRWVEVPRPPAVSSSIYEMTSVRATPDGEVWATGDNGNDGTSVILHYADGSWTGKNYPAGAYVQCLLMLSQDDGWAGGTSFMLHYVNGQWQGQSITNGLFVQAISMTSPTDGWAMGATGNSETHTTYLLHYTQGAWQTQASPANASIFLSAIDMVTKSEGWAVGDKGTILHYTPIS